MEGNHMEGTTPTSQVVERHRRAKKRLMILRITGPLAVALLVFGQLWGLARQVRAFDMSEVPQHLERHAEKLWPRLQQRATRAVERARPKVVTAITTQWERYLPIIEARLDAEASKLKDNVHTALERSIDQAMKAAEARQRDVIRRYVPEIANDDAAVQRAIEAVRAGTVRWATKFYQTTFAKHLAALDDLRKTLDTYYRHYDGDRASAERAVSLWVELAGEALGSADSTFATPEKRTDQ